ncbi:MAG: hypothetical protein II839_02690 [Kiritimatiellae bacterium]|nr:hypothetical protein [Kiritimatiellia bacterium]
MKKTLLAAALAAAAIAAPAATPSETAALAAAKQFYSAKSGDFAAVWNALPASYQKDVADVVKLFASKIDADLWTAAQGALKDIAGVALKKAEFALADVDEEDRPDTIRMIAKAAAVVKAASYDDIKAGNLAKVLAAKPLEMAGVTDNLPAFKMPEISAKQNDDGTVAVTVDDDTEDFSPVEGKWIPKEMADGFADGVKEAKEGLADFSVPPQMKQQIMAIFPAVSAAAKNCAKAKTKEEFQQAAMMGFMPVMMMAGSLGGGADADEDDGEEYDMAE